MGSVPHAMDLEREFSFASSGRSKTLSLLSALIEHQLCAVTPCQLPTPVQFSEALLLVAFIGEENCSSKRLWNFPTPHHYVRFKPGPFESDPHVLSTYYTWVFPIHCRNVTSNSYSHLKMMWERRWLPLGTEKPLLFWIKSLEHLVRK